MVVSRECFLLVKFDDLLVGKLVGFAVGCAGCLVEEGFATLLSIW